MYQTFLKFFLKKMRLSTIVHKNGNFLPEEAIFRYFIFLIDTAPKFKLRL